MKKKTIITLIVIVGILFGLNMYVSSVAKDRVYSFLQKNEYPIDKSQIKVSPLFAKVTIEKPNLNGAVSVDYIEASTTLTDGLKLVFSEDYNPKSLSFKAHKVKYPSFILKTYLIGLISDKKDYDALMQNLKIDDSILVNMSGSAKRIKQSNGKYELKSSLELEIDNLCEIRGNMKFVDVPDFEANKGLNNPDLINTMKVSQVNFSFEDYNLIKTLYGVWKKNHSPEYLENLKNMLKEIVNKNLGKFLDESKTKKFSKFIDNPDKISVDVYFVEPYNIFEFQKLQPKDVDIKVEI